MNMSSEPQEQRSNIQPLLDAVDAGGHVLVFDLQSREWKVLHALDARLQYIAGTVTLADPSGTLPPVSLVSQMNPKPQKKGT